MHFAAIRYCFAAIGSEEKLGDSPQEDAKSIVVTCCKCDKLGPFEQVNSTDCQLSVDTIPICALWNRVYFVCSLQSGFFSRKNEA